MEVQVVLGMLLVAATFPDLTNSLTLTNWLWKPRNCNTLKTGIKKMLNPEQYFQELKGFHKKLWLKDLEIVSLKKKFLMEIFNY